jgi:hypothetical protein
MPLARRATGDSEPDRDRYGVPNGQSTGTTLQPRHAGRSTQMLGKARKCMPLGDDTRR